MISQVLHAIKSAKGTVNINELSNKLGIERSALEGMIQHLVRNGLLVADHGLSGGCSLSGSCGSNCTGPSNCVFIAKMPKTYSLPNFEGPAKHL
jgi:hypothetical protein